MSVAEVFISHPGCGCFSHQYCSITQTMKWFCNNASGTELDMRWLMLVYLTFCKLKACMLKQKIIMN